MSDKPRGREFFITEEASDAGECGFPPSALSNAVQLFDAMQCGPRKSIAEIAAAFNAEPALIADAVRAHHWMFLETADGRLIDGLDEATGSYSIPTAIDDYSKAFIFHEGE